MLDVWLTDILGYPVYNSLTPPDSDERSLTCAKVQVADVATVNELTALGFRVVDVNVQLGAVGYAASSFYPSHAVWAEPSHHKALLKIAESCFSHSRFHRDVLTLPDANRIKREWLKNCLDGQRGLEVLIALDKERPVGFLAVGQDGNFRTVDLLGVEPKSQDKGVGQRLLRNFKTLNPDRILVAGTSLSNAAALRLYETQGFRFRSASYVLHLHRGIQ